MRRKILIIIASITLLAGLGFLLFPPVSNFIGQKKAEEAAEKYDKQAQSVVQTVTAEDGEVIDSYEKAAEHGCVDPEGYPVSFVHTEDNGSVSYGERIIYQLDLDRLLADSLEYNKMLLTGQGGSDTIRYDRSAFDLKKYGISDEIYCYISAWTVGLQLPVYLGASDEMMSYGAGHLYGTSLPVGDTDSNVAVAGHTGYIGRIFFDNIRNLQIGHEVKVTTWWETTTYHVVDFKTIRANDSSDLLIKPGKQLLTLITCEDKDIRYVVICEKDQSSADG